MFNQKIFLRDKKNKRDSKQRERKDKEREKERKREREKERERMEDKIERDVNGSYFFVFALESINQKLTKDERGIIFFQDGKKLQIS